jgi:hypothetical protein
VFIKAIGKYAAQVYIIQLKRGENRFVPLDRNLVIWEQKESPPD